MQPYARHTVFQNKMTEKFRLKNKFRFRASYVVRKFNLCNQNQILRREIRIKFRGRKISFPLLCIDQKHHHRIEQKSSNNTLEHIHPRFIISALSYSGVN